MSDSMSYAMEAIHLCVEEMERQSQLKEEGRFRFTPSDRTIYSGPKLAMLIEEVGEVGRCVLSLQGIVQEQLTHDDLRKELVQVAAVALSWVESLGTKTVSV